MAPGNGPAFGSRSSPTGLKGEIAGLSLHGQQVGFAHARGPFPGEACCIERELAIYKAAPLHDRQATEAADRLLGLVIPVNPDDAIDRVRVTSCPLGVPLTILSGAILPSAGATAFSWGQARKA